MVVAVVAVVALAPGHLRAQDEFPQTTRWGSGLIDIPVAWVSPITGDFGLTLSGESFETNPGIPEYRRHWNSQGSLDVAFFHLAEVGISSYTTDPEHGLYGQLLLLNQDTFHSGLLRFLPSVAFGVRNVGPYHHIDRFGMGYYLAHNPGTGSAPLLALDSLHQGFETGNTVYGVATKSVALGSLRPGWSDIALSFTLGMGNGLFSNHGTLPVASYASSHTGGIFFGVKGDIRPSVNTLLSVMVENNAWDYNVGASLSYRGLRASAAVMDLTAGGQQIVLGNSATALYNYRHFTFSFGWQNNVLALVRGDFLADRAAQLQKQRDVLLAEIGRREARIAQLQAEIRRYEAQNLLELEQRRARAQQELETEAAHLKQLQERLRRIQGETPGGEPTPPPPAAPPPAPPSGSTP